MIRKSISFLERSVLLLQLQIVVILSTPAASGSLYAQTNDAPPAGSYQWNDGRELATGIRFGKLEVAVPRNLAIHAVQVDTSTPGLRLHTTRRRDDWVEGKTETNRQTTRDFLRQSRAAGINMVLAVNADAFSPWPAPYNENTPSDLAGLAVSDGVIVSKATVHHHSSERPPGHCKSLRRQPRPILRMLISQSADSRSVWTTGNQ